MRADILAAGLFLVGISVTVFFLGYSAMIGVWGDPIVWGGCPLLGSSPATLSTGLYLIGGLVLATGLAISGYAIGEK